MFGVYDIATGALLSVGSVAADPLPDGTAILELPEGAVAFVSHDWQSNPPAWIAKQPTPITTLSVLDFKARFTDAERLRIDLAEIDHPSLQTRALLKRVREDLSDCKDKIADRADPRIQRGVGLLSTVVYDGAPLLEASRIIEIIGADAFRPELFA